MRWHSGRADDEPGVLAASDRARARVRARRRRDGRRAACRRDCPRPSPHTWPDSRTPPRAGSGRRRCQPSGTALGQLHRAIEVVAERRLERGRFLACWTVQRPALDLGSRLPEVVLGGHRSLLEERADPERRGGEPIGGRMRRDRRPSPRERRRAPRRDRGCSRGLDRAREGPRPPPRVREGGLPTGDGDSPCAPSPVTAANAAVNVTRSPRPPSERRLVLSPDAHRQRSVRACRMS